MNKTTLALFLLFPILVCAQVPNWLWARNSSLAFNGMTHIHDIDPNGNVVVVGDFNQPSVTFGNTTFTQSTANFADVYMVKYDPSGNVLWAKQIAGSQNDSVSGVAIDNNGNIFVSGGFNYDVTIGNTTLTTLTAACYIAKFDAQGNLIWARKSSGTEHSWAVQALDTDAAGNLYVAGNYYKQTLAFDSQSIEYTGYLNNSVMRVFYAKFDAQGNCVWLRGPQTNQVNVWGCQSRSISVDSQGRVAITGEFNEPTLNFDGITLTKTAPYDYNSNAFLVQYDNNGNVLWAKNAGTEYENLTYGQYVKHDSSDNLLLTGYFSNTIAFDGIPVNAGGGSKPFLYKFTPQGTAVWGTSLLADVCATIPYSVDTDSEGSAYVVGMTQCASLNFFNNVSLTMQGQGGLYVVKYDANGQAVWARRSGEMNVNQVANIKVFAPNEIYVAGTFSAATLTLGPVTLTKSASNYDLYLAKLYAQPLGTPDFASQKITAYPNPANSELFLENVSTGTDFSIADVSGRVVRVGKTALSPISVAGLASGIYVLSLENQSGSQSVKFVKR